MSSRLAEIKRIIEDVPNDPFPRYGLAMEYKNSGDLPAAHEAFTDLASRYPDYVAQYLMHGNTLVALRRPEEARAVLQRGIEVAQRAHNLHALGELRSALSALDAAPEDD